MLFHAVLASRRLWPKELSALVRPA